MIPEREIWRAALVMVKRYAADAMLEAAARADQLREDGDWHGAATWHCALDAIKRALYFRRFLLGWMFGAYTLRPHRP
jgi:hypothetical protein